MNVNMGTQWKPLSKAGLITSLLIAVVFWIYAMTDEDRFLFLYYVNLPFHEFGHILFGLFGDTLGVWGGTIMQFLIPLVIFVNFLIRRETAGTAFSAFWFGENLLNISVYIADARKMDLPLVGSGDHDWNIIFLGLGILQHDTMIAGIVKTFGWLVMGSAVIWLVIMGLKSKQGM